jgi:hypothetical protein
MASFRVHLPSVSSLLVLHQAEGREGRQSEPSLGLESDTLEAAAGQMESLALPLLPSTHAALLCVVPH